MNHNDKAQTFKREIQIFERIIPKLEDLWKKRGMMQIEMHEDDRYITQNTVGEIRALNTMTINELHSKRK